MNVFILLHLLHTRFILPLHATCRPMRSYFATPAFFDDATRVMTFPSSFATLWNSLIISPRYIQSDQWASGSVPNPQRKSSHLQNQQDFRRRSRSPECSNAVQKYPPPDKASTLAVKAEFPAGTAGRVYSACAVCLGRHPHQIVDCTTSTLWDSSLPSLAIRSNKILSMRDGRSVCGDWQRALGCPSTRHDVRHFCSGCASSAHIAQECPQAQKVANAHSL